MLVRLLQTASPRRRFNQLLKAQASYKTLAGLIPSHQASNFYPERHAIGSRPAARTRSHGLHHQQDETLTSAHESSTAAFVRPRGGPRVSRGDPGARISDGRGRRARHGRGRLVPGCPAAEALDAHGFARARPQPNLGRWRLQEGDRSRGPAGAAREDARARGAPQTGLGPPRRARRARGGAVPRGRPRAPGRARAVRRLDRPGEGVLRRAARGRVAGAARDPRRSVGPSVAALVEAVPRRARRGGAGAPRVLPVVYGCRLPHGGPARLAVHAKRRGRGLRHRRAGVAPRRARRRDPGLGAPAAQRRRPEDPRPRGAGEELFPGRRLRADVRHGAVRAPRLYSRLRSGRARDAGLVPPGDVRRGGRAHARLRPGDADVGAAINPAGGSVPVVGGEAAAGGAHRAHAERSARGPAESGGCARGAQRGACFLTLF